jgi:hypothetical protein
MAGLAIGLTITPMLFYLLGERATFVVVGAFLPGVYLLARRRLTRIDASVAVPEARLNLLRSLPIFAPLSAPSLERVASRLIPTEAPSGTEIVRQGDPGDRFYVIESGGVRVSKNGHQVATLERGDFFGEIALLREIPRTATVIATTDTLLYALERDDFLEAVTGHPQSAEAADAVTRARLADR